MKTTDSLQINSLQLIGIDEVSRITGLSKATIWRHNDDGIMPEGLKIGRSVRWRLRTGNPKTGIADWIESGCPHCGTLSEGGAE